MASEIIRQIADYLIAAEVDKREVVKVTSKIKPDLTVEEAYEAQELLVQKKLDEGKRIVGPKMGLTSKAKWDQMGVSEPIYGYIFDYMLIDNGGALPYSELIHPKVEAEIAFVIGEDIEGPGITGAQVLAKTEYVLPALEIIDSRYENFNFTHTDVIADNTSASRVVFGNTLKKPSEFDLELVGSTLSINGKIRELGTGAAVLGHPANAIAVLANVLARKGERILKGDIILSGAITSAVLLNVGDFVSAKFDGLGEVTFTVTE
ncbi:fumarylacetoacetate hydrolase family protein [Neobacillus sp. MER 74]|uniref:2-keto-4-pentenoate hydratase n=1 Tax=Neobacillus sp. MER 74 TaxID=2939566 RepID=UPI0020420B90|nr:fumarylacetoacetate hydrolase family protein [Neobacillus sp. MER 74]MCM3116967.1 fumarylacetoacetate hydrolase family protein [Neobacillus sp. MER 74]